jgi:large repetitive protein
VLSNDTDADGDSLSVVGSSLSHPAHGTVELITSGTDAGKVRYTPNANYNGSDTFTYKANDDTADSNEATVSVTVTAVNDAPVAVNDSYSTNQGNALAVNAPGVLGNDSDVDSANLTAAQELGPSHGQLALNANGSFTYTPVANFSGADSFTYKVHDGSADSNTATVTITVNPVGTPAPSVFPVSPPDQATDVLRSTKVTATFNVAMKPSSLTNLKSKKSTTFILTGPGRKGPTQVSATVTCNNPCTTAPAN